jgi:hypothetical protein
VLYVMGLLLDSLRVAILWNSLCMARITCSQPGPGAAAAHCLTSPLLAFKLICIPIMQVPSESLPLQEEVPVEAPNIKLHCIQSLVNQSSVTTVSLAACQDCVRTLQMSGVCAQPLNEDFGMLYLRSCSTLPSLAGPGMLPYVWPCLQAKLNAVMRIISKHKARLSGHMAMGVYKNRTGQPIVAQIRVLKHCTACLVPML